MFSMFSAHNFNIKNFYNNILKNFGFIESIRFLFYIVIFFISKKFQINIDKIEKFKLKNQEIYTSYIDGNIGTFLEIFDQLEYKTIFNLTKSKKIKPFTLLDFGANMGYCYSYFKSLNLIKNYVGVEPIDYNFKLLFLNTFSNNTVLYKKALWVDNNGVNFTDTTLSNSNSINKKGNLKVETVTLEEVISNLEKDNNNIFLKIDIEGAEYDILDLEKNVKLIEDRINYFAIEFHNIDKINIQKYIEVLSNKFNTNEQYKEKYNCLVLFGVKKTN